MVIKERGLSSSMNAKIIGSGSETIILAHGFGTDQSIWEKIVPDLAQHFNVFLFDWLFSGAVNDQNLYDPSKYTSYEHFADDLIDLLDEFNLKSVIFLGHSMSGMIGCIASVKRPQLFKQLILVGASPRFMNTDDYEGGFEESQIKNILSDIETNYNDWASNFSSLVVDANDPASVDKVKDCFLKMRHEVAIPLAKIVFYSDEREILNKVETPCTIIQSSSDIVVPNTVAFYMQKNIKAKSTVEIIDADGHFPQLTAQLQLLDALKVTLGVWS
ncbi:strigolactone esterase D14 [Ziziphus jujuba]|uniref:Strigolactone esterase D14 n=2 Tax=Ziziphus jujuba TaxID=326968 RepID=A0A6P4B7X1_ZIZJJ|nr:strigolactone esterase D14 [Ziziphus jujuba]KAH7511884.1 hypothetical protein FEM48_Zijuj12G0030200 [Ziziphus jujuba var. spinosa]